MEKENFLSVSMSTQQKPTFPCLFHTHKNPKKMHNFILCLKKEVFTQEITSGSFTKTRYPKNSKALIPVNRCRGTHGLT